MDDKRVLRSRLKAARARRDQSELTRLAESIAHMGVAHAADAVAVAAYAGVGDEPPTRPLIDALVTAGHVVLLPVVTPDGLAWGSYVDWDTLVERRGLLEPRKQAAAGIETVGLVFAPALAVDRQGNRLGRGGAHYDRALIGVPRERIVAVVFADEVLDVVPTEAHDVRVGAALTPDGVIELQ
jgi:5-formyltetrahydrofolate cyclo-ligase